MNRRHALLTVGGLAAAGSVLNAEAAVAADHEHHHLNVFDKCAAACAACSTSCSSCFEHCVNRVSDGHKSHSPTLRLCNDCSDLCAVAARLSARKGPLTKEVCEACVAACDRCAEACENFSNEPHMVDCAKHCRACAAACRQMLKHLAE